MLFWASETVQEILAFANYLVREEKFLNSNFVLKRIAVNNTRVHRNASTRTSTFSGSIHQSTVYLVA